MAIESDDYREEIEVLKKDPIILDMMDGLPSAYYSVIGFFDSFQFMKIAGDEYHRRGGTNAKSIGGPARAMKALYEDSLNKENDEQES
jgi:hypothetical protein